MSKVGVSKTGVVNAVDSSEEALRFPGSINDPPANLPQAISEKQIAEFRSAQREEINNKSWYQRLAVPVLRILHQSPEIVRQQVGIIYGGYRELVIGMYEAWKSNCHCEGAVGDRSPSTTLGTSNLTEVIKQCYQKGIERSGNYINNYRMQCENEKNNNGIGSILGNTKDFFNGNAISDLINLHPITAYANPVMEVADAAYDESLLALTNELTKIFGGDEKLTYLELKRLQGIDKNFIIGKHAFDVAKIASSLAINPQIAASGLSGLKAAGSTLKCNVIFSGVISTGEEFKRLSLPKTDKEFSLSETLANISANTLSNTANSMGMAKLMGKSHLLALTDDLNDFLGSAKDASLTLDTTNPLSLIGHMLVMGATTKDLLGDGPNDLKLSVSNTPGKFKFRTKEELEEIAIRELEKSNKLKFVTEFEIRQKSKELGIDPNNSATFRGLTDKEKGIIYIDKNLPQIIQRAAITHELRHLMAMSLSDRQKQRAEEVQRLVEIRAQYQEELKLREKGLKREFYPNGCSKIVPLTEGDQNPLDFSLDYNSKRDLLTTITKHVDKRYKPEDFLARAAAAMTASEEQATLQNFIEVMRELRGAEALRFYQLITENNIEINKELKREIAGIAEQSLITARGNPTWFGSGDPMFSFGYSTSNDNLKVTYFDLAWCDLIRSLLLEENRLERNQISHLYIWIHPEYRDFSVCDTPGQWETAYKLLDELTANPHCALTVCNWLSQRDEDSILSLAKSEIMDEEKAQRYLSYVKKLNDFYAEAIRRLGKRFVYWPEGMIVLNEPHRRNDPLTYLQDIFNIELRYFDGFKRHAYLLRRADCFGLLPNACVAQQKFSCGLHTYIMNVESHGATAPLHLCRLEQGAIEQPLETSKIESFKIVNDASLQEVANEAIDKFRALGNLKSAEAVESHFAAAPDPQIQNICNLLNAGDYDSLRNLERAIDEGEITEELLQDAKVQKAAREAFLEQVRTENYGCLGVILELINFSDDIRLDAEFQENLKVAAKILFKENYSYGAIRACKLSSSIEQIVNDPETRASAQKVFEKDFEYDRRDYDTGKELHQIFNFEREVVSSCARKGIYFAVAEGRYDLAKSLIQEYNLSSPLTQYHMDLLLGNALQENNSRGVETLLEMFPFPPEVEKEIFSRVIGDLAEHHRYDQLSRFISITKVDVSVICAALLGAELAEIKKQNSRNILEDLARLNLPISFVAIVSMAIELAEDKIYFDKDTTSDQIIEEYLKRKIRVEDQEIKNIEFDMIPLLIYLVDPNFLSEKKLKSKLSRLRKKLQEQTSAEDYIFDRVIHEIPELLRQSNRHPEPEQDAICVEKGTLSLILIKHFSITGEDILAYDRNISSKGDSTLSNLYQRTYIFLLQSSNFQAANIGKILFYCKDQSNVPLPVELVNLCNILGADPTVSEAVEERLDHNSDVRFFLEYGVHEILTREDYQQGEKLNLDLSKISLLRKYDIQLSELRKLKGTEKNKFCRKIIDCLFDDSNPDPEFVTKPLDRAARYVGYETMIRFCYRVDTNPHDALLGTDPLIELLRAEGIIGEETAESPVMRNLLEQVNLDKARYGYQGSHAQLNKVIREMSSTGINSLWRRLNEYSLSEEGHLVAGKLSKINNIEDIFSTWQNLKSFYEAYCLYKQRKINEKLVKLKMQAEKEEDLERKKHLEKLRSFAIELLKSPVIELSAVEEFLLNPNKFWERWDMIGNTALTALLSVNELTRTISGPTSEELQAAFVSGTIDRLQLPALRIDYKTGPADRTLLQLVSEEILNLNHLQNGNKEKTLNIRKGQLRAALKRKKISFALQDYLIEGKGELDVVMNTELEQLVQDRELYNEIRRIVPIDKKEEQESNFQIEVFLKSDPRGALAGNEVADCMPFGSRKDNIYKIYPFAQLMVRYQTEEGHWVTMAQSIVYLANDVGEISDHSIGRYSKEAPPEQATNQQNRYLLLDNLQVAGNYKRKQLLDKVRPLLADFLQQYQRLFAEELGIDTSEVIIGANFTPAIMFKNQRANTYLPLTMPSYTDNNLPQVFVLETRECEGIERKVKVPEKIAAKQYQASSIPNVQPLSIWDSTAVTYVQMTSNAHRPRLIESLPTIQNKIIATAIANEHRGKTNLSFKFVNPKSSKLEGYLLALECEKDLGEKGILIDDLSILAGDSFEIANQSLFEAFSEAYQREYGAKGNVLPIFIKKNAKTTKQDMDALISLLEKQFGLRFRLEEKLISQEATYFVLRYLEQKK